MAGQGESGERWISRRAMLRGLGAGAAAVPLGGLLNSGAGAAEAAPAVPTDDPSPEVAGLWAAPFIGPQRVIAVHAAMLHTGKVLLFYGNPKAALWEPSTGNVQEVDSPADVFCAGQCFLPDGRLLVAGGAIPGQKEAGPAFVHTFDPVAETWNRHSDMRQGRYYPTTTLIGDGRVLITNGNTEGGRHAINEDLEVFDPATNITTVVGTQRIGLYAHQALLPDGTVLVGGPSPVDSLRIHPADWSVETLARLKTRHLHGGGFLLPGPPEGSWKLVVTAGDNKLLTETYDAANPALGWQRSSNLPQDRAFMCTVLRPDGKVIGIGGESDVGGAPGGRTAPIEGAVYCDLDKTVLEAAPMSEPGIVQKQTLMFDPATGGWAPMAVQTDPRGYHTTAVLLPDGRVLSAGGTGVNGSVDHLEIYSPPYLFQGARPEITSAPTDLVHAEAFTIETPDAVARVVLMAPCATTHTNDMSQRHVELAFTPVAGGVSAVAPPSPYVAPPSHYMLFILNATGVPSPARWVHL